MKQLALLLIKIYQISTSFLPRVCRFSPSCSNYTYQAIEYHGVFKGIFLGVKRIAKCHPFCDGGYDPVPKCCDTRKKSTLH